MAYNYYLTVYCLDGTPTGARNKEEKNDLF